MITLAPDATIFLTSPNIYFLSSFKILSIYTKSLTTTLLSMFVFGELIQNCNTATLGFSTF